MQWRGVFAGALALAGLQVIVSTSAAADRTGSLLELVGKVARHFLSPYEPAIPDLRKTPATPPPPPPTTPPNLGDGRPRPTAPGNGDLRA